MKSSSSCKICKHTRSEHTVLGCFVKNCSCIMTWMELVVPQHVKLIKYKVN